MRAHPTCVCLLLALLLAGCAAAPKKGQPVSHRTELSRPKSLGIASVPRIDAYLNGISDRLLATPTAKKAYSGTAQVVVSAGAGVNAWTAGRALYVPWSAAQEIQTEPEMAALLAHELSHILLDHSAADDASALASPLLSFAPLLASATQLGAAAALIGGQFVGKAGFATWARAQELDADALGLKLMTEAGYSVSGMVDLLENIGQYSVRAERKGPLQTTITRDGKIKYSTDLTQLSFGSLEDSHPEFQTRRSALQERLRELDENLGASVPDPDPWAQLKADPEVQASMDGLNAAYAALHADPARNSIPALSRAALDSPVSQSFVVQMAANASLPRAELNARGVASIEELARRPDAPIVASMVLLSDAVKRQDWASASRMSDSIRERYELTVDLSAIIHKVYMRRADELGRTLQNKAKKLTIAEQVGLLKEQTTRNLQASKVAAQCMALAKDIGNVQVCSNPK